MLEILQRVHDADLAESPLSPGLADADLESAAQQDGRLSEETIARLLEKVSARSKLPTQMLYL